MCRFVICELARELGVMQDARLVFIRHFPQAVSLLLGQIDTTLLKPQQELAPVNLPVSVLVKRSERRDNCRMLLHHHLTQIFISGVCLAIHTRVRSLRLGSRARCER